MPNYVTGVYYIELCYIHTGVYYIELCYIHAGVYCDQSVITYPIKRLRSDDTGNMADEDVVIDDSLYRLGFILVHCSN